MRGRTLSFLLCSARSLVSHYYTLLVRASRTGEPVFNALSFVFPADTRTHAIDEQFMVGEAILASPVLQCPQPYLRLSGNAYSEIRTLP